MLVAEIRIIIIHALIVLCKALQASIYFYASLSFIGEFYCNLYKHEGTGLTQFCLFSGHFSLQHLDRITKSLHSNDSN